MAKGSDKYPYDRGDHLIVALNLMTVHGDESGIEQGAKYCLLLGYAGEPSQWNQTGENWARVLADYGVPYFHASDFFLPERWSSPKSPYRDWNEFHRFLFLSELLDIITASPVLPVGWGIDVRAFHDLADDERRYLTGAFLLSVMTVGPGRYTLSRKFKTSGSKERPYFAAFHLFLEDAMDRVPSNTELHFVLDRQNVFESQAKTRFRDFADGGVFPDGKEVSSLTFASAMKERPLQIADLYCYVWSRMLNRYLTENIAYAARRLEAMKPSLQVADARYFKGRLSDLRATFAMENKLAGMSMAVRSSTSWP